MIAKIAAFELRYHLRQPLFYILFLSFFLITFGAVTSEAVTIGGAIGNVHRNAPFVIMQFLLVMSIFGVLTTTAFVANSVHRDFEIKIDSLFFTTPVTKAQYLLGRFLGSMAVAVMVYFGVALAIMVGGLMPWIEPERLGAFTLTPYLFSFAVLVIPNLLLFGAVFFSVAALTRSLMATYAAVIGFFVAFAVAESLIGDLANETVATLLDPFGFAAFGTATRYWTVFEKNARGTLPFAGPLLWNRLLWIGVAMAVLAFAINRFRFATGTRKARKEQRVAAAADKAPLERTTTPLPRVSQSFGRAFSWRQYFASVRIETATVLKSIPFIIIVLFGMANIWGASVNLSPIPGTTVYPVTHMMVDVINNAFGVFALILATFYAGDIVWRERSLKLNDVYDSMPHSTWVTWASKLTALIAVIFTSLTVAVLTAIFIQATRGYFHFELGVYLKGVFLYTGCWLLLLSAVAFFLQVVLNQKFVGFLGVMVWFIIMRILPAVNLEHRLYRVAARPPTPYSDMNGFGHFAVPAMWFNSYWLLFVAALMVIAHLLWVRGTETAFSQRLKIARQRFAKPVAATLVLFLAGFVATGCFIYYNTNVLNDYRTTKQGEKQSADFEKKYKKYQGLAQPRITDVQADVDIHPAMRAVEIRGSYVLANKTAAPIAELHVTCNPELTTCDLTIPGAAIKSRDQELGYTIFHLQQPLAAGATTRLTFRTSFAANGFPNSGANNDVVGNGMFINNFEYFPHIGYMEGAELQDRNKRRKYGLAAIQRMKPPADAAARMNNQISRESDWLNLDTTVSTSGDQIALAPGYLQREWRANGRRYFHYRTTSPILGFWSYLSARYEVKRDQWKGVPIEIYYHKEHAYNVDRMIYAVKKSFDYYTANFSPYQHKQVRILEFPNYASFAQSFPNTIPYSESIGFVTDLRAKDDIDFVFYVTAHEIAHQWWAHQVIGGNVQGSTMIVETMAQYSALMVMEKEYGREKMRRFLEYELDRYLAGRGGELVEEQPLMLVENQQYIHYRKGSLAMYALRDYIGEERVNRALAKFIRDHAFQGAPYPTASELVSNLRAETQPEYHSVIQDLFETITLFDNRTTSVTSKKRADGRYDVRLTVESKKLRANGRGDETPVPVNDWIDIGVLAAGAKKKDDGKVLFLEKRHITKPVTTFDLVVAEAPAKAGIDPFVKLIDRNPKDNTKTVQ